MKKVSLFAILIMSVFIFGSTLSFAQPKRMVVWNGETASKAAGWTNPAATCTISAQTIEAHSGKTAVEFRFKGDGKNGWLGCGWDWASFQVGEYGDRKSVV